ncbi:MAG: glycosyltransferase family A protein [Verrucomicrobiota bacterium]
MAEVTAVIRYKDSAQTLPEVLKALTKQTLQPHRILGLDTGSKDGSTRLLQEIGATVETWDQPYHHSRVLNFGISKCETPLVLCLSSHTVMHDHDIIERMVLEMAKKKVCACSIRWDDDPFYSSQVDWQQIQAKGMKFGSIYSNSLGIFRRDLWEQYPFDESINGMEDYDWALHFLLEGYSASRINANFGYQRSAHNRYIGETARAFMLADRYGLDIRWLGYRGTVTKILKSSPGHLLGNTKATETFDLCCRRLRGALFWRSWDHRIE